ncbi:hypothetical protein CJD36_012105 [Flavipsychrobacter stenotrophus]|uniref:RDD domain-containing protein n=1 Tax=Flavipsychrobacter stenotrophus TaxID=2077091 RepID=A0A2S7SUW0_9BACT|nr:RDD family protein [Flavipsychrobacter stenotrophus]PQJ10709.1 hypothetical protein CJD36_012105 [Flavipsychrobacter stenotrophus]
MDKNVLNEHTTNFPSLLRRCQANFIDRIITYAIMAVLLYLASEVDNDNWPLKISAILMALSYEPLMVSFLCRTIGQRITGITVVSLTVDQKISLLNSFTRFGLGMILGWISFLAIHSNNERRALNDLVTDTVLVI